MSRRARIISLASIVLLGISLLLAFNLKNILLSRLNELVKQDENRLYDYSYKDIELDLISGDLVLIELSFKPREKILDSLNAINQAKKNIFDIQLQEFRIKGLDSFEFLLNGEINLEEISFKDPLIKIYENPKASSNKNKDTKLKAEKDFFSDIVSTQLKEANIGGISFEGAKLEVYDVSKDTSIHYTSDSSNIHIKGIHISRESLKTNELFSFDSSDVDLNAIKIYTVKDYRIEVGRFYKSSTKENIYLNDIQLRPLQDKQAFMRSREFQIEWFDLSVNQLAIKGIDIAAYQSDRNIKADSLQIKGVELEIYKDKRLKKKEVDFKPIVNEIIRNINIPIHVPNSKLRDVHIKYEEFEVNAEKPLVVEFSNMKLDIYNFNTDNDSLAKNDNLKVKAEGVFMNSGSLNVEFQFSILDSFNSFTAVGSVSHLPLNELNPILENSAFIMFTDGKLNALEFNLVGNEDVINGSVDIDYNNLNNLQILRKKDEMVARRKKGKKEKSGKDLLSFLASNIAPTNYSEDSKHYRQGKVDFNRNKEKGVIHLLVNGIKSGILDSFLHNHKHLLNKLNKGKKKETK